MQIALKNKKHPHKLTATNNLKISSLSSKEACRTDKGGVGAGGEVQLKCNDIHKHSLHQPSAIAFPHSLFLIPHSYKKVVSSGY